MVTINKVFYSILSSQCTTMMEVHVTVVYFPLLLHQNQLATVPTLESWDQVQWINEYS